ncbi:MAG: glycosyltransferase, partial [Fervidobacterium sp.]
SSKITGVPLCCSVHSQRRSLLSHYLSKGLVGWLMLNFDFAIEQLIYSKAHKIIALSANLRNYVLSFGIDPKKITVIPAAIQTKCFGAVDEKGHESETFSGESLFKIGYVGRLEREKNILTLLQALGEIVKTKPDVHLLLIGDGSLKNSLIKYAEAKNISRNVHFLGTRQDTANWLQIFDIFVLPSYTEGMPIALLESMAAGKAIIASNIQGIREMVRHNEEAILVNPPDLEGWRQAILLLYNNPDLRARLGRNAKEKAKLYDVDVVYKQIVKVYQELIRCRVKK